MNFTKRITKTELQKADIDSLAKWGFNLDQIANAFIIFIPYL